jgi:signal transduction histidine kinase
MREPHWKGGTSFALSELEVYAGGENIARGSRVLSSGDPDRKPQRPSEILVDGYASYGKILELPRWLEEWATRASTQAHLELIEARLPALQADAQRRAIWLGSVLAAALALAAIGTAWRARRHRLLELEHFRLRLARDLHDEIGSNLAGIAVLSEMGANAAPAGTAGEEWREVHSIAAETMEAMREVLWVMGAREEAGFDLIGRMQRVVMRMFAGKEIVWRECPTKVPDDLPMSARRQMFLFFKEAVSNAGRHAHASRVELALRLTDRELLLEIKDNGRGFDPASVSSGVGIPSLRERARRLSGSLRIVSAPESGTTLTLRGRW